ncbi:MAG: DEAD/DEAH box helicase [Chlamydiales bacterium]|nr:DEAD/DEAH box helicase [Chlamydiales bacterium]
MENTLNYNIDPALSLRFRTIVITISNKQLADPGLLRLLMDDEIEWQKREAKHVRLGDNLQFPYFRLRPLHSYTLLQKLSLTQKLFFNKKRIVGDFFSKFTLEYLVEQTGEKYLVHALLHNRELSEYSLICQGSPHIVIHDSQLSFTDPNVAWQELVPFLEGPKTFTKLDYKAFQKEVDPTSLIELGSEEAAFIELRPTLQLVDNTCSFAKLENLQHEPALLKAGFIKKDLGASNYYCPTDKSLTAIHTLLQAGWQVLDAKKQPVKAISNCHLELDGFTLKGTFVFDSTDIPLEEVTKNLHARLMPLPNGQTGLLSFDSFKEARELLQQVEIVSGKLQLPKSAITQISTLANITYSDETLGKRLASAFNAHELQERLPTTTFQGTLRPYQQQGVNWLVALYESGLNGLLADEMGLGKTVQVLAFLSRTQNQTLIVVPTSLLDNWKREIEQFLPSKSHVIYHGPQRQNIALGAYDIIITSYGTIRSDITIFAKYDFECIVLDEAQAIKNSSTLTAKCIFQLQGRFRLSLTGTPIENALSELLCHFEFLEPGLIHNELTIAQLRKKIAPFFLRRKKSEVARDLPEKIDEVVWVTMNDEQQQLYDSFMLHLKGGLLKKVAVDGLKAHRMEIFEALLRLRQIACHPTLVPQLVEKLAPQAVNSAKFDLVVDDIETLIKEGKKVVLFSQFTSILHLFAAEAKTKGWQHLLLEGQTQNRQQLVDTFQNDRNYQLFLISLKAGGVGLNLTAADYVLLYDPWWNKAQEAQAIDRAHRIGRTGTVFSKRYYVSGSIEEKILALQESKQELSEALLNENGATNLTINDLHDLID